MYSPLPQEELQKLLDRPYSETTLPRKISFKNIGFAKPILKILNEDLKDLLHHPRKDSRKRIRTAYKLFLANFVTCVFTREGLSIAGGKKFYKQGSYLNRFHLTLRAVQQVVNAMLDAGFINKSVGNPMKQEVNVYIPTRKLEELITPLIYSVVEEIDLKDTFVIVNKPKVKKGKVNYNKKVVVLEGVTPKKEVHYVSLFTPPTETITLTESHPDIERLRKVNSAITNASFALKGPIKRIFSNNDIMQGGRIYCRFQGLSDRRARIRINTLINGQPIAEVDLSCNHAAMILALNGARIPKDIYSEISEAVLTPRNRVKFLMTRLIGCSKGQSPDLRVEKLLEDGFQIEDIPSHEERKRVESYIKENYPLLDKNFKKGLGVYMQVLEGDILLNAMCSLIDKGIITLPMHDSLATPIAHIDVVREALEESWMNTLGVSFKPYTKVDVPSWLEEAKLAA